MSCDQEYYNLFNGKTNLVLASKLVISYSKNKMDAWIESDKNFHFRFSNKQNQYFRSLHVRCYPDYISSSICNTFIFDIKSYKQIKKDKNNRTSKFKSKVKLLLSYD